jgi:membrane protein
MPTRPTRPTLKPGSPEVQTDMLLKLWKLLRQTISEFVDEDPFTLAGALSYYTLLSLAPLLLVIVAVAGIIFGEEAARGEVLAKLDLAIGTQAAGLAQDLLAHAYQRGSGWLSATIGGIGVLVGATTALAQLQFSLNKIWGVKSSKQAWYAALHTRAISLLFVLVLGAAVITSLIASSVIAALSSRTADSLAFVWKLADIAVPLALMTVLFAVLFKLLPDAKIRWRDIWVGAAITSVLFTLGRMLIGIYIGRTGVTSAYGAAGSVVGLMVWIYYSSVIILLGAELTQVYARLFGGDVRQKHPDPVAAEVPDGAPARG